MAQEPKNSCQMTPKMTEYTSQKNPHNVPNYTFYVPNGCQIGLQSPDLDGNTANFDQNQANIHRNRAK